MKSAIVKIIFGLAITLMVWISVNSVAAIGGQQLTEIGHWSVIVGTVAILVIVSMFRRFLPRLQFKRVFGVAPSRDRVELGLLKAIVDAKLRGLAVMFEGSCISETEVQQTVPRNIEAYGEQRSVLHQIRKEIKIAKKLFWKAHGLASWAGFQTYRTHGDYLVSEENPLARKRQVVESEKRLPARL